MPAAAHEDALQKSGFHWFKEMEKEISNESLKYVFASRKQYIEDKFNIRIFIYHDSCVKPGSSIGFFPEEQNSAERKFIIVVNSDDVLNRNAIVRFRVAHELGHICCHHEQDIIYMYLHGLGDFHAADNLYNELMEKYELEADDFGACMLFALGEVIERKIISEDEFNKLIENDEIRTGNRKSKLNEFTYRNGIRRALRRHNFSYPPVPILCHALEKVFPQYEKIEKIHRNAIAMKVHHTYREIISEKQLALGKPTATSSVDKRERCKQCPQQANDLCDEAGAWSFEKVFGQQFDANFQH